MADQSSWWNVSRRLLELIHSQEVKTPLSFFFRLTTVWLASLVAILATGLDPSYKIELVKFVTYSGGVICVIIAAISCWRPHYLVYGESGHRAERRLKFGTERHVLTESELEKLPVIEANKRLPPGSK